MSHGKNICQQLKAIRRQIAQENDIPLEIPTCTYQGPCAGTCPQCESEVSFLEKELAKRITLGKAATVAGIAVTLAAPAAAQVNTIDTVANGHSISCGNHPPQIDYSKPTQGVVPQKTEVSDSTMRMAIMMLPATETGAIVPRTEVSDIVAQIGSTPNFTGILRGVLTDSKTKEPIPFANIVLYHNDTLYAGKHSDFDGIFTLKNVPTNDSVRILVKCVGYKTFDDTIQVKKQGFTILNINMASVSMDSLDSTIETPIIEMGAPAYGRRLSEEDIEAMPAVTIGGVGDPPPPKNFHPASEGAPIDRPRIKIKDPYEDSEEPHLAPKSPIKAHNKH